MSSLRAVCGPLAVNGPSTRRLSALRPAAQLPGAPDYQRPWEKRGKAPLRLSDPTLKDDSVGAGRRAPPGRKWWNYQSPTGAVGRHVFRIAPVTLAALGPAGGSGGGSSGGSGGSGGGGSNGRSGNGGNGGNGGSPMRGPTYLYALALLVGGLIAYFKKGSQKSLLFSAAASLLLLIAASLMHHRSGTLLAMGTSLVLAFVMGQRANTTKKIMPAGAVAIVSALMTIGYARVLA